MQDKLGKVGGLFTSEDAAMHFAKDESDHQSRRRVPRAEAFR